MSSDLKKLRPYDEPPARGGQLIPTTPDSSATLWFAVGVLWFVVAAGIGLLWIGERLAPDLLTVSFGVPVVNWTVEISPSTTQSGFFTALVWGWLTNALIGVILFATPRLTGRRLQSDLVANLGLGLWNVAVAAGLASVYVTDLAQAGLLAEFPLPVDGIALLGLLAVNAAFWRTALPALRGGYVSLLYFGIALLALLGAYALMAALPLLNLGEVPEALVNGAFVRVVEWYWIVGAAVGALYYLVPRASGNPLASSGLALLGFATWLLLGVVSALGALVDPSIPYALTSLGNAATIMLLLPAFLITANLLTSLGGRWSLALGTGTIPFAVVAIAFFGGAVLLDAIGALRSVQQLVGTTSWWLGGFLFMLLGFATFAAFAAADHALPRMLKRDWRASPLTDLQLWAVFIGTTLAGLAFMAGGLAQGSLVGQSAPADAIQATLFWYDLGVAAGLALAGLGALSLLVELFLLYTSAPRAEYVVTAAPSSTAPAAPAAGN